MRSGNNGYVAGTCRPVPRATWESLLSSDPDAVVTQSLAWRDAVFADGRYQDIAACTSSLRSAGRAAASPPPPTAGLGRHDGVMASRLGAGRPYQPWRAH